MLHSRVCFPQLCPVHEAHTYMTNVFVIQYLKYKMSRIVSVFDLTGI